MNTPAPPRDREDVVERLCLRSGPLIEEVLKFTMKTVDQDDARAVQINGKATSLLASSGLSVTVAFTFGGTLLTRPDLIHGFERVILPYVFVAALLVGVAAGLFALLALLVRDGHKAISDNDILAATVLDGADEATEKDGLRDYRRFMAAHVWAVGRENGRILDQKATSLRRGQVLFFVFMFLVLIIGVMIGRLALQKG